MELIRKRRPIDRLSAFSGIRRIPGLNQKPGHNTVDETVVVVAFQSELDEVARGFGAFFGKEFDFEVA